MFDKKNKPSATKLDSSPITTVIGPEITFKGNIEGGKTIKIDGKVIGNINVEQGIILGEKGHIAGDIHSKSIIIFGNIEGNINAQELILKNSGNINGDITTNSIDIEMGGKYNGNLKMELPKVAAVK